MAERARILNTTDNWMSEVTNTLLRGRTCVLPTGCGAYVLAGAISLRGDNKAVAELINSQKGRHKDSAVAFDMPPEEIPFWIQEEYRERIADVVLRLNSQPFGIIAPVNDRVPSWHRVYDKLHGVNEKLFAWADPNNVGPLADLYRYVRVEAGLSQEQFTLIATSGNEHGLPINNKFDTAFEQLGHKEGVEVAVRDPNEGGEYSRSVTVVSALPLVRGRNRFHLIREGSVGIDELKKTLPEVRKVTPIRNRIYKGRLLLEDMLKGNYHR